MTATPEISSCLALHDQYTQGCPHCENIRRAAERFAITEKICQVCGNKHTGIFKTCPDCIEGTFIKEQEVKKLDEHAALVSRWIGLCPPAYANTDWSRPELSPVCREAALKWWATGSKHPWLGIHGGTGRGKTRAMWEVVKRHHFAGRKVFCVDATSFADAASDWHCDDRMERRDARQLIRCCHNAGLLLFDDLGKERRCSPAVAKAIHTLFEDRARFRLTTLWTSEKTGDELAQRFGDDYADGIIRRLREFSEILDANPDQNTQPQLLP